ncbi:MAG TPA: arylsulfotransferase family protein [Solirubrobacteraceae bacterium]|nr:arylsulfotransferase family protein [Solirubrobacteraceae bacterium]
MRRAAIALVGVAVAVLAVLLATGVLNSSSSAVAPACLPSTLEHSAQLPASSIYVSPAPGTNTANPNTQISFLGLPAKAIHDVSVSGQSTGRHTGRLVAYSQGDGASFVSNGPFAPGERVSVSAMIDVGRYYAPPQSVPPLPRRQIGFSFRVDTPYSTASVAPFPNPQPSPADYESFATLPGIQAPTLHVTLPDGDPAAGDIFTSNGPSAGKYGPLIYTPQGRLVWFDQLSDGKSAENLSVQSYEGQRDLTFWQGKVLSLGFGQGEDVVMNNRYQTIAKVPGGNGLQADLHDFQLAPHGVAYTTAFNPIRCDVSSVEGGTHDGVLLDNAVQEIDVKTGLVRWEWHSLDHIAVTESETAAPKTSAPWDWFHLNSIDVEPSGDLLISARSTWAAYQLQAGSGNVLWRLGGNKSSFAMGPGTKTAWQHDARMLPDGEVTMFDDGSNPPVHSKSRGVRLRLDPIHRRATLRFAYVHPNSPLLSASQGNMQTLPSGNVVIGYGGVPQISEYTPGGTLLFDAYLPFAMSSYRAFRFAWSAQPASAPAVLANLNNTGEETIVRASWNGATDVNDWRALAGTQPQKLTTSAKFPASDFESSTILTKRYGYVAVQALDSRGRVLATSQPARVGSYAASFPGGAG